MQSTSTGSVTRWGVWGAVLAAVALTVSGVVAIVSPDPYPGPEGSWSWYVIESCDVIGEIGVLVALVALHLQQSPRYGRVGAAGCAIAAVGTVLFIVSTVMWLLPPADGVLLDVLFNGALAGWLVGFPMLGLATLRARVLPRWCGWVLTCYTALFAGAFVLVDWFGAARAPIGLPWLAVAYALWSSPVDAERRTVDLGA